MRITLLLALITAWFLPIQGAMAAVDQEEAREQP
jgi:hypothetical protein